MSPRLGFGIRALLAKLGAKSCQETLYVGRENPILSDGTGLKRKNEGGVPISVASGNNEAEREIAHVCREVPGPPTPFAHLLLPPDPHCAADSQL